ncbi:endoribonuclease LACTB2, partial [Tremellales sp. Uapishka_1]
MATGSGLERLSDTLKVQSCLSAHVNRILGQNPGMMTLQGTNSYLLQPPSSSLAPIILVDTSSPHTAQQYVDLLFAHLHNLGLQSGLRETHFESKAAQQNLTNVPEDRREAVKKSIVQARLDDPTLDTEFYLEDYGPGAEWTAPSTQDRRLPPIEHIVLTHRHLDHTGALKLLLTTLKKYGLPKPRIWKLPSSDEASLLASERERPTSDAELLAQLPDGTYHPFSPFQPIHPILPGLMISIIDPDYRHLLKHDKEGKPKWNEVPEIARVSVRCLKTPGHTMDSVSLVMLEGEKGVFTGDTVLGQGTTVFTDLAAYMTSLKTLLALKPNVLYPAHGPHIPSSAASMAHIQTYIKHRQDREDEIVRILQAVHADPSVLPKLMVKYKQGIRAEVIEKETFNSAGEYAMKMDGKYDTTEQKEKRKLELEEREKEIKVSFEGDEHVGGITIALLVRMIYVSDDEKLVQAAGKSVKSHLEKLEADNKVGKTSVRVPVLVEADLGEVEEQEGWTWLANAEREQAEQGEAEEAQQGKTE